ncbi:MAG TPA: arginine--tRNA ligase [Candidatus Dormibacteraeota bacterium]|nr:arginine--tRNA ligase [Candidatus Dormibacteraeota bacterium]
MPDVQTSIARAVRAALEAMGAGAAVEATVEPSGRPEFGDWSSPAPLRAARVLRRAPLQIAEELRARLEEMGVEHVREWTATPPGYVNARLDDTTWAPAVIAEALALDAGAPVPLPGGAQPEAGKTLVEHTNINTNKAAHVGHLRNACLGDAVSRILRRTGHEVEVNNYIDDTGVQVADVIVGLRELGMEARDGEPYDQFCSRVYVEVMRRYEQDPSLLGRRVETLRHIEARDNDVAQFAKDLARRIVQAHLDTMRRFDIGYDLLTWESDILELGFWRRAFEMLRERDVVVHVEEGKNAGTWVMPWEDAAAPEGDTPAEDADAKILVKSDGVATYTAKDIAYQLWKFGLLGLDFHYRRWNPEDARTPATTTSDERGADLDGTGFGHARRVVNVIDARQAYPQQVVRQAVHRLGFHEQAERSVHLAYEVVALSLHAAEEMGLDVEEGRTMVALSGRRGIEVRADDLLDAAVARVRDKAESDQAARSLAAGAVRYYLQKFGLTQIIAFDFGEALRTTGDTGVYLQYAHARAAGILRKVEDDGAPPQAHGELDPTERALLLRLDGYRGALAEAAQGLAPPVLCTYAFQLASALSDFYEHTPPIVREQDPAVRRFRRALVAATRATLADALATLGIAAPEKI